MRQLEGFTQFKSNYPSLGPPDICDQIHQHMVRRVACILDHGAHIQYATKTDDFLYHRREEVDHTSELLADCATSDVTTQPGFYTRFMPTLRSMGRAANFIDALTDSRQDKKEGKIQIQNNAKFYKAIGGQALRELVSVRHIFINKRVIRQFYDMSIMRLNNRVLHGKRPYSSLKNLS